MTSTGTLFNILTAPPTAKITTTRSLPISLTPSFLTPKDPSPCRGLTATAPPRLDSRVVAARAAKANPTGEQKWTQEGSVTESLPNGMFRVLLDNQDLIIGYISGKIRKNFIRILPGDRVKVEVSRYDTSRGRIVYRHKSSKDPGSD